MLALMLTFLRQCVSIFKKSDKRQVLACLRRSEHVFGRFESDRCSRDVTGGSMVPLWRVKAVGSHYVATIEEYKGRAIRVFAWRRDDATSRFRLSELSQFALGYARRQKHGMAEIDCRSQNGLHGRGQRWSVSGRRERFVFRQGEPRCIWTGTRACERTGPTSFWESASADLSDWRHSAGINEY